MRGLGRQELFEFLCALEEPSLVPYFYLNKHLMALLSSCCLELVVHLQVYQVNREYLKYANGFHNSSFLRAPSQLKTEPRFQTLNHTSLQLHVFPLDQRTEGTQRRSPPA